MLKLLNVNAENDAVLYVVTRLYHCIVTYHTRWKWISRI